MNRLFKKIFIVLFSLVFMLVSADVVLADVGPKPSVNLSITGTEGRYYVTLLSEDKSTGPYSNQDPYSSESENYEVFEDYEDEFYFLYNMKEITGDGNFNWTYYPPEVYKVLVYIPETDTYLESEVLEAYAFNSYYNVNITGNQISVKKDLRLTFDFSDYFVRLIMTITIELLIALLFRFSSKSLRIIVITNFITQTLLIAGLMYLNYRIGYFGEMITMLPLELVVLVTEVIVYQRLLEKEKRPALYALIANTVSFFSGLYLLMYFVN